MFCAYNSLSLAKKSVIAYVTSVSSRNIISRLQRNKLDSVPIQITLFRLANLLSCYCAEFWASGPPNWLLPTFSGKKRGKQRNKNKDKKKTHRTHSSLTSHILLGLASIFLSLFIIVIHRFLYFFYLLKKERERRLIM